MRELFVWYRITDVRADAARSAVLAMQQSLRDAWPGLQARLLVRRDAGVATWMETYARSTTPHGRTGVDAPVETAIAAAAGPLEALIDGQRHVEAFEVVGG